MWNLNTSAAWGIERKEGEDEWGKGKWRDTERSPEISSVMQKNLD